MAGDLCYDRRVKMSKNDIRGLTQEEVRERRGEGLGNKPVEAPSKSVWDIVRGNVFTYFNFVFLLIAVLLFAVGSYRDLTFLPIIFANTAIGILQEMRAKVELDKIMLVNTPKAKVIRDGEEQEVRVGSLVQGDVVIFGAGDQIPADAVVLDGEVAMNESLLTGEADEIKKQNGNKLLSGSFVVSGRCVARLTKVGEASYISKLTLEAKKIRNYEQSEIIRSLNTIVKFAGVAIVPIGGVLFLQQFVLGGAPLKNSVQAMVAAVIGMIPEGLFLLSSVALAISAMRLAKNQVLIHDMKCIETLARVDVLCVDKTGTITEENMKVADFWTTGKMEQEELRKLLGDFVRAQERDTSTMEALMEYFREEGYRKVVKVMGFSSQYKYSGVEFEGDGVYVLGAPELMLGEKYEKYREEVEKYGRRGFRVLMLAKYEKKMDGGKLDERKVMPCGLITMINPVRENAPATFRYFAEQGVEIKVISGDNPVTVSEIAKQAGIAGADKFVDASKLRGKKALTEAVLTHAVFGRVSPEQKRKMVQILKKAGRTVAMTGDGVNDVLALKDADCSIAMASGSDAAAQASQLVLIDSDFAKMPEVVREGRRVVNNLERSGSLFLVKNIFSLTTAILVISVGMSYPLVPAQISLVSLFTIGGPAFLLSQMPNEDLIRGKFIKNVIWQALPGGVTDVILVAMAVVLGYSMELSMDEISTCCTVALSAVGMAVIYRVSKPLDKYKGGVFAMCLVGLILSMLFLKPLFGITKEMSLAGHLVWMVCVVWCMPCLAIVSKIVWRITSHLHRRHLHRRQKSPRH